MQRCAQVAVKIKSMQHTFNLPSGVTFFERGWLSSNNVLIQDRDQAILVDSGYWTHAAQTYALIQTSLGDAPLTRLLNTHLHSDHCGGNSYLQAKYPGLQTLIPPGHASFVDNWDPVQLTYVPTGQHCPPFSRSASLQSGETFEVGGKSWRIHAAPGHDPHSVVIFNEVDGVLISADALWENGFGVVFPEIEGMSAFDDVASTLDVIESLNPALILPGHGSAFTNVRDALVRARNRLTQFRMAPVKHANYAAKVLLKFKLLELQKIKLVDFLAWGLNPQYLKLLHAKFAQGHSYDTWFLDLCTSLEKSKACVIENGFIINRS